MKNIIQQPIYIKITSLINQTKKDVAITVNSILTLLYWNIGKQINDEILQNSRVDYGKEILQILSAKLTWSHFKTIIYIDDTLK